MYSDDVQCVNVLGTDCTDGTICMESLYVGNLHLVTDMYHCVLCLSIGVGTCGPSSVAGETSSLDTGNYM